MHRVRHLLLIVLPLAASGCVFSHRLPGFELSPHWDEQVLTCVFEPQVRVQINAPSPQRFNPRRPTRLILYALPNGNSIEWTVGRRMEPGLDWHYDIQHIGAQVRLLRHIEPQTNIVIAYLETAQKSWPTWRREHADQAALIHQLIAFVQQQAHLQQPALVLTGHSGGGSMTFGYLDGCEAIPDVVERIAMLDSNYGFDAEKQHGRKLLAWLQGDTARVLYVLAYDDRKITLNGKPVVSPTGGTWRATQRMIDDLAPHVALERSRVGDFERHIGLDGRLGLIRHVNPQVKILHTALVGPMNGFACAMLTAGPHLNQAPTLGGPPAYTAWIQPF